MAHMLKKKENVLKFNLQNLFVVAQLRQGIVEQIEERSMKDVRMQEKKKKPIFEGEIFQQKPSLFEF